MNRPGSVPLALAAAERDDGVLLFIGDPDQAPRVLGLFLGLGEHDGDRLPVPVDAVILHDRQIVGTGGLRLAHERRRRIELRRVAMRHHQDDAGAASAELRRSRRYAARDRRVLRAA